MAMNSPDAGPADLPLDFRAAIVETAAPERE
jgi:hypothetical protein